MYFTKNNDFHHGIMFHHFHDDKIHPKSQGSITKDDFYKLIKFIGKKNILSANDYLEKFKKNKLKKNEVCFTFDDAIKGQIDVALPILEEFKIKSFFFVYTSIFEGRPDNLELFRYFRTNCFRSIDEFYNEFNKFIKEKNLEKFYKQQNSIIQLKRERHPSYSLEDIKFRLVRDILLTKNENEKIIFDMMNEKNFSPESFHEKLYFNKKDLKNLDSLGHTIGLHSHDHHTLIEKLPYNEQKEQYKKCIYSISNILGKPVKNINTMSHPCGSYNQDTLEILKDLGIELGFKQMMFIEPEKGMKKINNSSLEIARVSHSLVMKTINK